MSECPKCGTALAGGWDYCPGCEPESPDEEEVRWVNINQLEADCDRYRKALEEIAEDYKAVGVSPFQGERAIEALEDNGGEDD